jgi:histidinol-phosphate aminotransferase
MSVEDLARPAVRHLKAYVAAAQEPGTIRLNANENPVSDAGLNRYPEVRPAILTRRLAEHFGVPTNNLLATRGSSEALDLLIRSFCRENVDHIVITPPTFEMYRVYADIQGAGVVEVPLDSDNDFELDVAALLASCTAESKIIFLCTPNNPTGTEISRDKIKAIATARRDKSLVVVDEAYIEFSDSRSVADLLPDYENLVVLRTLSKALALAGARCGAVLGSTGLVNMLDGVLSPYALSQPVIHCIMSALTDEHLLSAENDVAGIVGERNRLADALATSTRVEHVWPSSSNFLLVRFRDVRAVQDHLYSRKILIREFQSDANLEGCARITVGTAHENDQLISALDCAALEP